MLCYIIYIYIYIMGVGLYQHLLNDRHIVYVVIKIKIGGIWFSEMLGKIGYRKFGGEIVLKKQIYLVNFLNDDLIWNEEVNDVKSHIYVM